jgi:hypothetical protein
MFDPKQYGAFFASILEPARLPELGPGRASEPAPANLLTMPGNPQAAFAPHAVRDTDMAAACEAGLWLYHDYLDRSHSLSQDIKSTTGSYWHGIMHRREPDAANAAYWFRRVDDHPIFEALANGARELGLTLPEGRWDPFSFIEMCEKHRGTGSEQELLLRRVQQREWELLFDYSYHGAIEASAPGIVDRLHQVAALLRDKNHLDRETQESLADLTDELAGALGTGKVASTEEEKLGQHVLQIVEALQPHQKAGLLHSARDHLKDAILTAEVRAPLAAGIARQLLDVIGDLGI